MPVILTPTPRVRFTIMRLRQSVAEPSRFEDQDLLDLINEGYRSACQRSSCLQAVTTLIVPAGFNETELPFDWARTIKVYQAGRALDVVPWRHTTRSLPGTYYQYEGFVGLGATTTDADTSVVLYYARIPTPLDFNDDPEWGPEWDHLLRHYAAWRCTLAAGGAQTVKTASLERARFELGVQLLRVENKKGYRGGNQRLRVVTETRGAPIAG
jgi:hypothetical protein